jgi:hypothetical protein
LFCVAEAIDESKNRQFAPWERLRDIKQRKDQLQPRTNEDRITAKQTTVI